MLKCTTYELNDTTPTLIVDGSSIDGDFMVRLQVGATDVIVGADDVSTSNGYNLTPGTTDFDLHLDQGDSLYGVTSSGTGFVGVLVYSA